MTIRRVIVSDKTYAYLGVIRVFFYPGKKPGELLEEIIDEYEQKHQFMAKLLEE